MFMETINQIMILIGYSVTVLIIVAIAFVELEHYINRKEAEANGKNGGKSVGRTCKKDSKRA